VSFAAVLDRLTKLENPYPGLRPFETSEAHLFFGRDQQVLDLLDRVARNRFVAVLGLSGSGKSSLVYAGLIPALSRGRLLEPGRQWQVVTAKPRSAPFANLAESLGCKEEDLRSSSHGLIDHARRTLSQNEGLFLLIDQFEELFRYKDMTAVSLNRLQSYTTPSEAGAFIALLLASARSSLPIYVVITMRTDYLGDCAEFPEFPEALNESQYLVPRLTREQRRQAIEGPLGCVRISSALIERILNDAGDEPDQLPILQHAIMRTWWRWNKSHTRAGRSIEMEDYQAAGGFDGALDQHADELLDSPAVRAEPKYVEIIFKRLTARSRGIRERRDPARLSELWDLCGAASEEQRHRVDEIVKVFRRGDATFLSPRKDELTGDTYIDITHESLIRNWKVLAEKWLTEEEFQSNTFIELLDRARGWKAGKKEILSGIDLSAAVEWDKRRNRSAKWAEHYAEPGAVEVVEQFIKTARWREKRRRWLTIGLISSTLVILSVFWNWYKGREAAKEQEVLDLFSVASSKQRTADAAEQTFQDASNALFAAGPHTEEYEKVIALGLRAKDLADEANVALKEARKKADDAGFQSTRTAEAFRQISDLQTRLGKTQNKLENEEATQRTAEKEPSIQTTQSATSSAHTPIDWNAAIRYARLISAAYMVTDPSPADPAGLVISDPPNYTVLHLIYGNDVSTDTNPSRGNAVINYGFLALSPSSELVVAIRGTEGIQEWIHDAQFLPVPTPFASSAGSTEAGFASVYLSVRTGVDRDSSSLIAAIKKQIASGTVKKITVCGHSLGAALATLTALDLALNGRNKAPVSVYTYGSPRVGDPIFVQRYNQAVPKTFRIANRADLVPKLPLPPLYEHVLGLNDLSSVTIGSPPKLLIKPQIACQHILTSYLYLMTLQAGGALLPLQPDCIP
jgi:hypothetical protein